MHKNIVRSSYCVFPAASNLHHDFVQLHGPTCRRQLRPVRDLPIPPKQPIIYAFACTQKRRGKYSLI